MLTADVDPGFERAYPLACARIGCQPIDLLGVIYSESGGHPAAHNAHGDASGILQFMPPILVGLGWTAGSQAFRCLSFSEQLPYVASYLSSWKRDAGAWTSAGRIYQATFLPATLRESGDPSYVIAAHGGKLGWAFDSNASFDANGDGRITISELTAAIERNARGSRWIELLSRLGIEAQEVDPGTEIVTAKEVQQALNVLGLTGTPLGVDGIVGPKTRIAIREFQELSDLHVDGIAGPETRKALERALHNTSDA